MPNCARFKAPNTDSTLTTEEEYIALSTAMRGVILIIRIIQELRERKSIEVNSTTDFHCKVFEDNSGALELEKVPKIRPRTKHINVICHWFLEHVQNKPIKIYPISTQHQLSDIFTKPLPSKIFLQHRKNILHW